METTTERKVPRLAPLALQPATDIWSHLAAMVVHSSASTPTVEFEDEPTVTYGEPVTVVERRVVRL